MVRVVVFLGLVGVIALAAAWIADRPGEVVIVWLDHRIATSVAVLVAVAVLIAAAAILLWSVARGAASSPRRLARRRRERRAARGHQAIAGGLIAVGAGDARAAARHAAEAKRFVGEEPLALLLEAQSAQLKGDRQAAERTFTVMAGRKDTQLLGLHGLFVEARRREDMSAARSLAEEAARRAPALTWAARAVLETRCADGDWDGALAALDSNMKAGLLGKPSYRRQRAVLLTAQALALLDGDRDASKARALEAVKLAPDLVPAAALAGRFLAEAGDTRKAARIIETAWRASPHPDLADAYRNLRPADSARERLDRMDKLDRLSAGHIDGALALARAAIDAHAFARARAALEPFLAAPTRRVALIMAELEEAESGDIGRAREWVARALRAAPDPAWTADGFVSETWMPVSPTGRLDGFEWKVPLAELPSPLIEPQRATEPSAAPAPPESLVPPPAAPAQEVAAEAATETEAAAPVAARPVATVIPIHAPDDPGTEPVPESEPVPEAKRRWRSLFG